MLRLAALHPPGIAGGKKEKAGVPRRQTTGAAERWLMASRAEAPSRSGLFEN
jgi:hypothetical protein